MFKGNSCHPSGPNLFSLLVVAPGHGRLSPRRQNIPENIKWPLWPGGCGIDFVTEQKVNSRREKLLTDALCRAMIVKKEVRPDRSEDLSAKEQPAQCPEGCHACCKREVVLDLTTVEALMIFLLNRESLDLIDTYTKLHDPTGYCPFMIMDQCIIHAYKPTACQMFMPFAFEKETVCYYLSEEALLARNNLGMEHSLNSNCYDIHGFMLKIQQDVADSLGQSFFKNIYEGIVWWREHYATLPAATRGHLESIVDEDARGRQRTHAFAFEKALREGHLTYLQRVEDCTAPSSSQELSEN